MWAEILLVALLSEAVTVSRHLLQTMCLLWNHYGTEPRRHMASHMVTQICEKSQRCWGGKAMGLHMAAYAFFPPHTTCLPSQIGFRH